MKTVKENYTMNKILKTLLATAAIAATVSTANAGTLTSGPDNGNHVWSSVHKLWSVDGFTQTDDNLAYCVIGTKFYDYAGRDTGVRIQIAVYPDPEDGGPNTVDLIVENPKWRMKNVGSSFHSKILFAGRLIGGTRSLSVKFERMSSTVLRASIGDHFGDLMSNARKMSVFSGTEHQLVPDLSGTYDAIHRGLRACLGSL